VIPWELNDAAFIVVQPEPSELEEIKALRDTLTEPDPAWRRRRAG
jgi:hypothetical protein